MCDFVRRPTSTLRHIQPIKLAVEPVPLRRHGTRVRVQDFVDIRGLGGRNLGPAVARHAQMPLDNTQGRHQRSRTADQRAPRKQGWTINMF